jgi:hypothetical protein
MPRTHRAADAAPAPAGHKRPGGWYLSGAGPAGPGPQRQQAVICPRCQTEITDPISVRTGYCEVCKDFTLLCAAGRFAVYLQVLNAEGWWRSCTARGAVLWRVTRNGEARRVLLCSAHDQEVRSRQAPWVTGEPVPV